MALVEDTKQIIYPIHCQIVSTTPPPDQQPIPLDIQETNEDEILSENEEKTTAKSEEKKDQKLLPQSVYLLSGVAAGWFEHCEQKRPRFWWLGGLKDRYAYAWEFLKVSFSMFKFH